MDSYMYVWFFIVFFNFGLSYFPARIAEKKGYSFIGFFLLGALFSLAISLVVSLLLPQRFAEGDEPIPVDSEGLPTKIECPYCAEVISVRAKLCKHCQQNVEEAIQASLTDIRANQAEEKRLELLELEATIASQQVQEEMKAAKQDARQQSFKRFLGLRTTKYVLAPIALLAVCAGVWGGFSIAKQQSAHEDAVRKIMAQYEDWPAIVKPCSQPSDVSSFTVNSVTLRVGYSITYDRNRDGYWKFLDCISKVLPESFEVYFEERSDNGKVYCHSENRVPFVCFTSQQGILDLTHSTSTFEVSKTPTYREALRQYAEKLIKDSEAKN